MKTLLATLLASTTLLISSAVNAFEMPKLDIMNIGDLDKAEASLILGYASIHLDELARERLNETNPSIGFEAWDISVVYVSKNSFEETSFYVTYRPDVVETKYVDVSLDLGFATGYKPGMTYNNYEYYGDYNIVGDVAPLIGATAEVKVNEDFSANVSVNTSVIMFSGSYNF